MLFIPLIFPAFAQENYNNDWEYNRKIYLNTTATGANVSKDIAEFPVLIRLNRSNFKFKEAKKRGEDIRFSDYQGNNLSYEIECWQRNMQKAEIWVKVPLIHGNSSSNYIKIHWGNQEAKDSSDHRAVFERENGFVLVLHLNRYCMYRYKKPQYQGPYKKYKHGRFSPFKHGMMEYKNEEEDRDENSEDDTEVNVISQTAVAFFLK